MSSAQGIDQWCKLVNELTNEIAFNMVRVFLRVMYGVPGVQVSLLSKMATMLGPRVSPEKSEIL